MLRSSFLLKDRVTVQRLERCLSRHLSLRSFSSEAKRTETDAASSDDDIPKQPFVTAHLDAGEWDIDRKDPFFKPKPPRTAKLISAEDFANRPPVTFDGEFSTLGDSMISLSWLDHKTCRQIYQIYVDMMVLSQQQHQTTSHEYVCRVLAQKFNITPWRAAGVIQLQHSEEQMRTHTPELLCDEQAKNAETMILQNIRDAYRSERTQPPKETFVEDPVGIHGRGEADEVSKSWTTTNDIYDMDEKVLQANVRDAKHARLLIDGHIYKEDVEDSKQQVKTDGNVRRLLKQQSVQQPPTPTQDNTSEDTTTTSSSPGSNNNSIIQIPYPETNANGVKRPRWKYVAKVVNTRNLRKKGRKVQTYTNNNMENTIVEEDGLLRVATVAEAKQVAWKPTRDGNEYIFGGAKKAWLQKTVHGKTDVWGRMPITRASEETVKEEEKEETVEATDDAKEEDETNTADDGEKEEEVKEETEVEAVTIMEKEGQKVTIEAKEAATEEEETKTMDGGEAEEETAEAEEVAIAEVEQDNKDPEDSDDGSKEK